MSKGTCHRKQAQHSPVLEAGVPPCPLQSNSSTGPPRAFPADKRNTNRPRRTLPRSKEEEDPSPFWRVAHALHKHNGRRGPMEFGSESLSESAARCPA